MSPRHQQAVMRRENEIQQALYQSSSARKFAEEFGRTIQPYMQFIEAENATPIQAVQNLMQTAALLRTATPVHKANLVADLVRNFNIPLEALDSALTARLQGRSPQQDPLAPVAQIIDQKLAPFQQLMQGLTQRQQQLAEQQDIEAQQTVEQFVADPQNEFAADLSQDMADILEFAAGRGIKLSLQDAYQRATLLHPQIAELMAQRKVGQVAAQQTAAAQNARNAAVSVSGSGAPSASSNSGESGDDVRSALVASLQDLGSRR
jgi:hypothetical protein